MVNIKQTATNTAKGYDNQLRGELSTAEQQAVNRAEAFAVTKVVEEAAVHQVRGHVASELAEHIGEEAAERVAGELSASAVRGAGKEAAEAAFKNGGKEFAEGAVTKFAGEIGEAGVKAGASEMTEEMAEVAAKATLSATAKNAVDYIPVVGAAASMAIDTGLYTHQRSEVAEFAMTDNVGNAADTNAILDEQLSDMNWALAKQTGLNVAGIGASFLGGVGQIATATASVGVGVADAVDMAQNAYHDVKRMEEQEGPVGAEQVSALIEKVHGEELDKSGISQETRDLMAASLAEQINNPESDIRASDLIYAVGDTDTFMDNAKAVEQDAGKGLAAFRNEVEQDTTQRHTAWKEAGNDIEEKKDRTAVAEQANPAPENWVETGEKQGNFVETAPSTEEILAAAGNLEGLECREVDDNHPPRTTPREQRTNQIEL